MAQIQVRVMDITVAKETKDIFMLILKEVNGERRLPIIIGGFEAKSIMVALQDIEPKRPLIYDAMIDLLNNVDMKLLRVVVVDRIGVVFHSKIVVDNRGEQITLDVRTSDAIAVALRSRAPIYVEEPILEEMKSCIQIRHVDAPIESYFDDELATHLQIAIDNENYERAQEIKLEMQRRDSGGERIDLDIK